MQEPQEGSTPGSGRSTGEGMTTHSSILAWRIPWTEVPDALQSMGLQRVRHDWTHNTQSPEPYALWYSSQKTAWRTTISGKFQVEDNNLFCICNKVFVSKKRRIIYFNEQKCQFLHILEPLWNTVFKISSWGDPRLLACLEHLYVSGWFCVYLKTKRKLWKDLSETVT